jgi:hypothetical protein
MGFYSTIKTKIVNFSLTIKLLKIDYLVKIINNLISLSAVSNSNNNLLHKTLNIIYKMIFIQF